jgi:hypothetical protein
MIDRFGSGAPMPEDCRSVVPRLKRPTVGRPLVANMLSERTWSYLTHPILDDRQRFAFSELCIGGGQCGMCSAGLPVIWGTYTPVWLIREQCRAVLAITLEAARALPRIVPEGEPLRGQQLVFARIGKGANGVVRVTRNFLASPDRVLPAFPISETLRRVWRCPCDPALLVHYGPEPEGGLQ